MTPNHWTTMEVPKHILSSCLFNFFFFVILGEIATDLGFEGVFLVGVSLYSLCVVVALVGKQDLEQAWLTS